VLDAQFAPQRQKGNEIFAEILRAIDIAGSCQNPVVKN